MSGTDAGVGVLILVDTGARVMLMSGGAVAAARGVSVMGGPGVLVRAGAGVLARADAGVFVGADACPLLAAGTGVLVLDTEDLLLVLLSEGWVAVGGGAGVARKSGGPAIPITSMAPNGMAGATGKSGERPHLCDGWPKARDVLATAGATS